MSAAPLFTAAPGFLTNAPPSSLKQHKRRCCSNSVPVSPVSDVIAGQPWVRGWNVTACWLRQRIVEWKGRGRCLCMCMPAVPGRRLYCNTAMWKLLWTEQLWAGGRGDHLNIHSKLTKLNKISPLLLEKHGHMNTWQTSCLCCVHRQPNPAGRTRRVRGAVQSRWLAKWGGVAPLQ